MGIRKPVVAVAELSSASRAKPLTANSAWHSGAKVAFSQYWLYPRPSIERAGRFCNSIELFLKYLTYGYQLNLLHPLEFTRLL